MRAMTKIFAGVAGLAALAGAAAPASAQYYGQPYNYGYPYNANPYSYAYPNTGPRYSADTQVKLDQCAADVEQRINSASSPYGGYAPYGYQAPYGYPAPGYAMPGYPAPGYAAPYGYNGYGNGRVVGIHSIERLGNDGLRIRGVATGGMAYAPNGYYRAPGQPDLRFKCDIDFRGYVTDVDLRQNTNFTYNWTPYTRRY